MALFPLSSMITFFTLAISSRGAVGILLGIFMTRIAVGLSKIRTHAQAFPINLMTWINEFFERAACLGSVHQRICLEAAKLRQKNRLIFDSFNGYFSSISPIECLLLSARPLAILRRIRAVIVDSLKREVFSRARPHILNEGWKTFLPSLTYSNPATAIRCESGIIRIQAALFHLKPDFVFGVRAKSMFHSAIIAHDIQWCKRRAYFF